MSNRFLIVLSTAGLLLTVGPGVAMTLQEKTDTVMQWCLASGKQQKIDGKIGVDGGITLTGPSLHGTGNVALTREEWSGLIGGISKDMTQLQADQADKVRDCMAPLRQKMMDKLLDSN